MRLWHRRRPIIAVVTASSLLVSLFVYFPWTNYNHSSSIVTAFIGNHRRLAVADDQERDSPTSRRDWQLSSSFIRNTSKRDPPQPEDDVIIGGKSLHPRTLNESGHREQGKETGHSADDSGQEGHDRHDGRSQKLYRKSPQNVNADVSSYIRNGKTKSAIDGGNVIRKDGRATRNGASDGGKCRPRHDIVFWKTHKCGSSTMQNMMFRHAVKNDLRLLLPPKTHLFDLLRRFNASRDVPRGFIERGRHFNIFAHHARFSAADVATMMPSNSFYFTILRSPLTLFESIYSYMGLGEDYGNRTSPVKLITFLKTPNKFYNASDWTVHRRYARNPLLYDLGLDPQDMGNKAKIADTILEVQLRFHFVMISEYFDESLILLKDLMCWDFNDITYLKLNAREKPRRTSRYAANLLKQWNNGDMQLYQYFNDTFWKRVQAYGRSRMENDVRTLRELNDRLMDRCVEEATNADDIEDQESHWHPEGIDIVAYRLKASAVNDRTCREVIKSEKLFTEEIRAKQGDYYFESKGSDDSRKWWHIKDETEKNVVRVLDAMLDRIHPQDNPPGEAS